MKYSILLFDADNTVLDFDKSEEQALQRSFALCGLHFDINVLSVYRRNNIAQWQKYERGEITRDEVLSSRFELTLQELNIVGCNIDKLAEEYEKYLHFGFFKMPHAEEVLQKLQTNCRLYIVSNGVLSIQNSRMNGSGLEKYFITRFISEEIGCPKPNKQFFDVCFSRIPNFCKQQTLIIGDSLSSDIQGGKNAEIDTCWYNPFGAKNNTDCAPTYEISDLRQLLEIVM